jgi:hypothetical protein
MFLSLCCTILYLRLQNILQEVNDGFAFVLQNAKQNMIRAAFACIWVCALLSLTKLSP